MLLVHEITEINIINSHISVSHQAKAIKLSYYSVKSSQSGLLYRPGVIVQEVVIYPIQIQIQLITSICKCTCKPKKEKKNIYIYAAFASPKRVSSHQ